MGPRGLEPRTCGLRVWCKRAGHGLRPGLGRQFCVSVVPIVSHRFPFRHGDETGIEAGHLLSFRTDGGGIDLTGLVLRPEIAASMSGSSLLVGVSTSC